MSLKSKIKDLTRIEAGKMLFRKEPFDIFKTVHDAVEMFKVDAARKNLEFTLDMNHQIPPIVIGDSGKLRQVNFAIL